MPQRASVVVIGGGIPGANVLHHVARKGGPTPSLVEKAEVTSGSTWHAAGQITQPVSSYTLVAKVVLRVPPVNARHTSLVTDDVPESSGFDRELPPGSSRRVTSAGRCASASACWRSTRSRRSRSPGPMRPPSSTG